MIWKFCRKYGRFADDPESFQKILKSLGLKTFQTVWNILSLSGNNPYFPGRLEI
jgi:hypothetical protein